MDLGQWLFQSIWCVHNLYIAVQGSSWNCLFSRWRVTTGSHKNAPGLFRALNFHVSERNTTRLARGSHLLTKMGKLVQWEDCNVYGVYWITPWTGSPGSVVVDYFYFTNQTHLFTGRIIRIIWDRWTKTFFVVLRMMVVIGVYKYRNVGTLCYQIAFMISQEMVYD